MTGIKPQRRHHSWFLLFGMENRGPQDRRSALQALDMSQTPGEPETGSTEALPFPDRRDYYALALLAAGVALMFWKVLFASRMLFYRDILNQSYPLARLIHQICRSGQIGR